MMSREIYTYCEISKLAESKLFSQIKKYPIITVSADLRKGLKGKKEIDKVEGIFSKDNDVRIVEYHTFSKAINFDWNTDQTKFTQMILISEFIRDRMEQEKENAKTYNWLLGCMRNIDAILSAIILLEEANVLPEQMKCFEDRNIKFFIEIWEYVVKNEPSIIKYRNRMNKMKEKSAWKNVFAKAFDNESLYLSDTIVFHGFYYITPYQESIMNLLEMAGYRLIYLIPYDSRYPFVYGIWDETYSEKRGYPTKDKWHIETAEDKDPFAEIFEGERVNIPNKLNIKEYASVMEFVDDIKKIKENGYSIYSTNYKNANKILMDYFPEEYGERKILSYPIGQFVSTLNQMWDAEKQTICLEEDKLIECFSSGWLSYKGVSGKRYIKELMYILPFFSGCKTINEWEDKIKLYRQIENDVISPFKVELDADESVSRWQEALDNPFINFSEFSVSSESVEVILELIKQLLDMAKELFGDNRPVYVNEHMMTLDLILRKHEMSNELYEEERKLVGDIFDKLSDPETINSKCRPADIANALSLFICGRFDTGEIQTNKVGLVYPMYFVDAAGIKNNGKVHICLCDVESMPGKDKDYIWPLSESVVKTLYQNTKNCLLVNLIQIMESAILCNRYFMYCALKNPDVSISWVSSMNEKLLAPSPYIKLVCEATGIKIVPSKRNQITRQRVYESTYGLNKIEEYNREIAPINIIKEARMDYALCPMKYVLGYILEKHPTYQSEFQQNYAMNALISAIYNLMKDGGISVDEVYKNVVELFPNMRKVEKRQIFDYISYDRKEDDMDYGSRTECGGNYYTDERLKIHYPNQYVRSEAIVRFGKLMTPDGRQGLDLYEKMDTVKDVCVFCQHNSYCRNAIYAVDQESYYD